jgi:putative DNA primase/helicase
MPSVPSLPAAMIPEALRPWLVDIAERASMPLEMPAIPAIVGLGAVVGRRIGIRPGRYDDFLVVPNLWGALVLRPGSMKTSAIAEGLKPLHRLAATARDRYADELDRVGARAERIKAEADALKEAMKKVAGGKEAGDLDDLERRYATKMAELRDSAVTERRYLTNDPTVEKLGELLRQNPRGLLVSRDELAGWLKTLEKTGREGDREFYLEAWNGDGSYTFDRIGRGTLHIPAVTVSIVGGNSTRKAPDVHP